jgi:flagellar protein FlaG
MQMTKISMDAGSYVQSAKTLERLKLIQRRTSETETIRPPAEPAAPANMGSAYVVPERENNPDNIINAIEKANKHYDAYDKILKFSIHEDTNLIMIKIINTKTEEIIAEIPPEKILDMIAQLWEMAGLLVDKRA